MSIGTVHADEMRQPAQTAAGTKSTSGVLDGQSFSGEFGIVGQAAKGTESWIFENGSFTSKGCIECGYPQSVYASQSASGGVDFKAKTACSFSDAEIVWEGTVKDGTIDGIYTWTQRRWYRTIRKQFWFKGVIEETVADTNTD